MELRKHQEDALKKMHNGCILNGRVGSGKSLTALAYYYILNGGEIGGVDGLIPMGDDESTQDLYIITTARKRDKGEWEEELANFCMSTDREKSLYHYPKVVIDSWNNMHKYADVSGAFFIFDEQRLVGKGVWVEQFYKIAKNNLWILLSATPGDTWSDYVPVFVANGYFKNRTEFERKHAIYSRFAKYPLITGYYNEGWLLRIKSNILVEMDYKAPTERFHETVYCGYDIKKYKRLMRYRFDEDRGVPFTSASELCQALRRIVNSDQSRIDAYLSLLQEHSKAIVFYNYDYELDILRGIHYPRGFKVAEWNGHKHEDIPSGKRWVYLVQYSAGCEGWNCTETDTIIFWSQTYSYKQQEQACGRIDRMNTPFKDLFYFHLTSHSPIDITIDRTLKCKQKFNETKFISFAKF